MKSCNFSFQINYSWFGCLVVSILLMPLFSACFTGIEGTKQIEVSRQDRKLITPSAEDLVLGDIKGLPLKEWRTGFPFVIADSKASILFNTDSGNSDFKVGNTLFFKEYNEVAMPDGNSCLRLIFADQDGNTYKYNTGKPSESAQESVVSDKLPMLIDLLMVSRADSILRGKTLWNRSSLAYLPSGERVSVLKYTQTKVDSVTPGSADFPIKVWCSMPVKRSFSQDSVPVPLFFYLDFNSSLAESRPMAKVFHLANPRSLYPSISDKVWEVIRAGNIITGMTKDECRLSLGNPSDTNSGHDYNSTVDLWQYGDGTYLRFVDGLLVSFRK